MEQNLICDIEVANCFDFLNSLEDNSIDLLLMDPPYDYLNHKIETKVDIKSFFEVAYKKVKNEGWILFCCNMPSMAEWAVYCKEAGFIYKHHFVWYKMGRSNIMNFVGKTHEQILCYSKGNAKLNEGFRVHTITNIEMYPAVPTTFERKVQELRKLLTDKHYQSGVLKKIESGDVFSKHSKVNEETTSSIRTPGIDRQVSMVKHLVEGYKPNNMISMQPENRTTYGEHGSNYKHPTVKPLDLFRYFIQLFSFEGDMVVDPFLGSGTTAVACLKHKRNFKGCDIFPEYVDISKARVQEILDNKTLF